MSISLYFKESNIHGQGLFTDNQIPKDTKITLIGDLERYFSGVVWITKVGRAVNHQKIGNCYIKEEGNLYFLYSSRDILPNEELTSDYSVLPKPFINNVSGYKEL